MEPLLDVQGLAAYLGVGTDWVYTQVEAGAIPHHRLKGEGTGRRGLIRFTPEQVREILASFERPATQPLLILRGRVA